MDPLTWAGRIGFSIYLIHVNVLNGFERTDLPRFLQFVLAVLATLALADLLYRLIETPAMSAGRRIASRLVERRAPSPDPRRDSGDGETAR